MAKRPTDSGLPRRTPGQALDDTDPPEGIKHAHAPGTPTTDENGRHLHRLGLIPHDHDDDGRPRFHAEAKFTPAGPVVSPLAEATDDTDPTLVTGNTAVPDDDIDRRLAIGGNEAARDRLAVAASPAPQPGRSIGQLIANTAMDTALGIPTDVLDERAHAREAAEILMEQAAENHRHDRLMDPTRLLDLEAVVQHMVQARGLK